MSENYQGKELIQQEKEKLLELNKILREQIPIVEKIDNETFGVDIKDYHVIGLGFANKGLDSIPEQIGDYKSLQILNLSGTKIKNIPDFIRKLPSLKHLILSYCNDLNYFLTPSNFKSLEYLDFSHSNFRGSDPSLWKLNNLKWIDITDSPAVENERILSNFYPVINEIIQYFPDKIYKDYLNKKINKNEVIESLISLIEDSQSSYIKINCLEILDRIGLDENRLLEIFELLLYSDEAFLVKSLVIQKLLKRFPEYSAELLKQVILMESSALVLKYVIDVVEQENYPNKDEFIDEFNQTISTLFKVVPEEAKFLFDMKILACELSFDDIIKVEKSQEYNEYLYAESYYRSGIVDYVVYNHHIDMMHLYLNSIDIEFWEEINIELPDSFDSLKRIRKLSISHNEGLKRLPNSLFVLAQRNFSDKYIANGVISKEASVLALFEIFCGNELEKFTGRENILDEIMQYDDYYACFYKINGSGHVIGLYVHIMQFPISIIPDHISLLKYLEELDLSSNRIHDIPESIGELRNLTYLDLTYNVIHRLPESIGNLISLKELYIYGHDVYIQYIPDSFIKLNAIKKLSITFDIDSISKNVLDFIAAKYAIKYIEASVLKQEALVLGLLDVFLGEFNKIAPNNSLHADHYTRDYKINDRGNIVGIVIANRWENIWDLSDFKINLIFKALSSLKFLEILIIHSIGFRFLPNYIEKFQSLKKLVISWDLLESLSVSIGKISSLRKLVINRNKIKEIPESISSLINLEVLDISDNTLVNLPKSIGNLKTLKTLDLNSNKIIELPRSIGQLKALKSLNLYNNEITELPESIGNLSILENLNLSKNNITELPDSMGGLLSVRAMNLKDNKLKYLPESFDNLKFLEDLELEGNNIKKLPNEIGKLKKAFELIRESKGYNYAEKIECYKKALELKPNSFKLWESFGWFNYNAKEFKKALSACEKALEINPTYEDAKNLKKLILEEMEGIVDDSATKENLVKEERDFLIELENSLGITIPNYDNIKNHQVGYMSKNSHIISLAISGVSLERLPNSIGNLKFLKYLNIGSNKLTNLPDSIGNLRELEELNLVYTSKLKALPKSFWDLKSLKSLNIMVSGAQEIILEDIQKFERLEVLSLGESIPPYELLPSELLKEIGKLTNLKKLYISVLRMVETLPENFGNLKNLELIDIYHSGLTSLPISFGNLKSLKKLKFSMCGLEQLPETIGNLKNLRYMELSALYSLKTIPKGIGGLVSLKELIISGCSGPRNIPIEIGELKSLEKLSLAGCSNIQNIPESIGGLTSLRELDLSRCNSLNKLPKSIEFLENLENLNLSDCSFGEIDFDLNSLKNLKSLKLIRTPIREKQKLKNKNPNIDIIFE